MNDQLQEQLDYLSWKTINIGLTKEEVKELHQLLKLKYEGV